MGNQGETYKNTGKWENHEKTQKNMGKQGKTQKNTEKHGESRKNIEKHGKTGENVEKQGKTWRIKGKHRKPGENVEKKILNFVFFTFVLRFSLDKFNK